LFRGRTDVFPVRFVSKKTGKPGYAPACSSKWEPALYLLRTGGRCSDCVNQAFVPVSDQVVAENLQGRHVIGAYPLLEDETCWFLAVDFDKGSWKEDVVAFAETCRSVGTPVGICRRGRSRQAIPIRNLPLSDPRPGGAEWIEAYRQWARRVET